MGRSCASRPDFVYGRDLAHEAGKLGAAVVAVTGEVAGAAADGVGVTAAAWPWKC